MAIPAARGTADDAGMLVRHETTPGYANLVRHQRHRRRWADRLGSTLVGLGLLGAFALVAATQPGVPTIVVLGIGLVLYALASFGLEEPPRKARSAARRHASTTGPHGEGEPDFDWSRLEEPTAG